MLNTNSLLSSAIQQSSSQEMIKWAQNLNAHQQRNLKKSQQQAHHLVHDMNSNSKTIGTCPAHKKNLQLQNNSNHKQSVNMTGNGVTHRYPNLMVFVSFSLSNAILKQLAVQVRKIGGQLVFRGLVDNSFRTTAQTFKELEIEALIDPTLFESFKIQRVPAFVVCDAHLLDQHASVPHDILFGNVTLEYALQQFVEKGDLTIASNLLKTLKAIK